MSTKEIPKFDSDILMIWHYKNVKPANSMLKSMATPLSTIPFAFIRNVCVERKFCFLVDND